MKSFNILSLDYGEKKIGLAFKASGYVTVEPFGNFKNQGDLINKMTSLIKEKGIELVVIGYPLSESKGKTKMAVEVERFAKSLRSCLSPKIALKLYDEYLSSQESEQRLRALGKNQTFIDKHIHSYSAKLILERFLENQEDQK